MLINEGVAYVNVPLLLNLAVLSPKQTHKVLATENFDKFPKQLMKKSI